MIRSHLLFLLLVVGLILSTAALAEDHGDHEESVVLSESVIKEFGIELATAGPGTVSRWVSLPAEVRPNRDRLAHIAPRFPGLAIEVRAEIGDIVKAGDTLAVIEASQSLAPYSLKTLIDGVVIEKHVTRGEPVSQERGALFTVADLRDVWIDLSVYQKHLSELAIGQRVRISAGHDLDEAGGTISYVAPIINEETRTATARVIIANPDGVWRPGMFVIARVEVQQVDAAVVAPISAIQRVEGKDVVFVRDEDKFVPRPVTRGREGEDSIEILDGISTGDVFVTKGAFTLKSELARGELAGGHGH